MPNVAPAGRFVDEAALRRHGDIEIAPVVVVVDRSDEAASAVATVPEANDLRLLDGEAAFDRDARAAATRSADS